MTVDLQLIVDKGLDPETVRRSIELLALEWLEEDRSILAVAWHVEPDGDDS